MVAQTVLAVVKRTRTRVTPGTITHMAIGTSDKPKTGSIGINRLYRHAKTLSGGNDVAIFRRQQNA